MASVASPDHAALMDNVYRGQRHIYDFTRKYYLFGRDRMIRELNAAPGMAVLEVGCGTGRNLELIARAWPETDCHGFDISAEMLKNASARLAGKAMLAQGDATDFNAPALFGRDGFDRVVISYALSMIPGWPDALAQAARVVAPGGSLHIVDFGDLCGIPAPLRAGLRAWLAKFHVTPRIALAHEAARVADQQDMALQFLRGPLGYYQLVRLTR